MIRSGIIRARDRGGPTGRKLVAMIISHQAPAFISNFSNASPVSFIALMSIKYVVSSGALFYSCAFTIFHWYCYLYQTEKRHAQLGLQCLGIFTVYCFSNALHGV